MRFTKQSRQATQIGTFMCGKLFTCTGDWVFLLLFIFRSKKRIKVKMKNERRFELLTLSVLGVEYNKQLGQVAPAKD